MGDIDAADPEQLLLPCFPVFFPGGDGATFEQCTTKGDIIFSVSIGQEPIVPDTHIAMRQYMKQEPPDELIGLDRHDLLLVTVGVVPPAEGDLPVFH